MDIGSGTAAGALAPPHPQSAARPGVPWRGLNGAGAYTAIRHRDRDTTAHRIVVRRYGPAALQNVAQIRHAALAASRVVEGGERILMLSVAGCALVAGPLRLVPELTTRPSARQQAHILGAADQITAALLAMALHQHGVPAVSLTWEQTGLTPQSVAEGARSGQLRCDHVRAAIERHPAVVLASTCAATADGHPCALDDSVVRLAAIALGRTLGASNADESLEPMMQGPLPVPMAY